MLAGSLPLAGLAGSAQLLPGMLAAAAVVAVAWWLLARRRFEQRIRMTPEEFADEAKSVQSDPKIRLLRQQARRQPTAGAA